MPRTLAQQWAEQASAIAAAADAGQSCRAHELAASLRAEVIQAGGKVPARLRTPLLDGVNSLADRIVCTPTPATVTMPAPPPTPKHPPHPRHPPPHHDHHGHGHGHHGDGQGDQG